MTTRRHSALGGALVLSACAAIAFAQTTGEPSRYLTPPPEIVEILDAAPPPQIVVSPARDMVALIYRRGLPSIAELARPMLRLAGERINPQTNGPHRTPGITRVTFRAVRGDQESSLELPADADLLPVGFSPDGRRYAFARLGERRVDLWMADPQTGEARALAEGLNAIDIAGDLPCDWFPDGRALLCRFTPPDRGAPPSPPAVPARPTIQETTGRAAPVRTYQDLLEDAHDERLFEYYFTSQLALVDAQSGRRTPVGAPGIFERVSIAPGGDLLLVSRLHQPFSYLVPARDFPKTIEVWTRAGELMAELADLPLEETVPIGGVPTGPRAHRWDESASSRVVWIEAIDEGDPRRDVPHRDRLMALDPPFTGSAREILRLQHRFRELRWTDRGLALVSEYDRPTRQTRTWLLEAGGGGDPRLVWERSADDRYADPGRAVRRPRPSRLVLQHDTAIYLAGDGASPDGDRPFLDRLDLTTLETTRLFQSEDAAYERALAVLSDDGSRILTQYETPADPPGYYVRDGEARSRRPLFSVEGAPGTIPGVEKQLITYPRGDGVELSGTLYLPPDYRPGDRLPVLMWAYPREYVDPAVAGQVAGSPHRFTRISGASHLVLLTQGYAIFDNPAMPVIGPGETANDTYVQQLVASAEAAIDALVSRGIADRERIAIGGHSYGAFMTANLLAHSDLFRAGIARSGAYNRTLTPFGFQNERRTFWEVPEIYGRMSPFFHAAAVNEPILLVHGEADNNSGTFPIQSERFYMALKGHGATARYVTLPYESHGYAARESVLHVVAEMLDWCDRWVKQAGPRTTSSSAGGSGY